MVVPRRAYPDRSLIDWPGRKYPARSACERRHLIRTGYCSKIITIGDIRFGQGTTDRILDRWQERPLQATALDRGFCGSGW